MYQRHQIKAALAKWGCTDLRPCRIWIGKESWEACRYKKNCVAPEGCQNPGPYVREMIYAVGLLPKGKARQNNVCFIIEGDVREWYVAGYYGNLCRGRQQVREPNDPFHPFGNSFLLAPWDVPGGERIDQHAPRMFHRLLLVISEN